MWPCGVIIFLSELFRSESITQVYASLHELLRTNQDAFTNLRKLAF